MQPWTMDRAWVKVGAAVGILGAPMQVVYRAVDRVVFEAWWRFAWWWYDVEQWALERQREALELEDRAIGVVAAVVVDVDELVTGAPVAGSGPLEP